MGKNRLHVKKGDTVLVLAGADRSYADRRRQGEVLEAHPKTGRVVVQGINMQVKHQRRTQKQPQGGRAQRPGPIHASSVMLICPSCDQPTRTRRRVREGTRIRVCRKCNKDID
ncbi:MAG: 50S ribosomal protein L24 [Armatimonadota bacterium]